MIGTQKYQELRVEAELNFEFSKFYHYIFRIEHVFNKSTILLHCTLPIPKDDMSPFTDTFVDEPLRHAVVSVMPGLVVSALVSINEVTLRRPG